MRKLAAACLGFAVGIAAVEYIGGTPIVGVVLGLLAAASLAVFIKTRRFERYVIILCAALVGCGWLTLFNHLFYQPSAQLAGTTKHITATVREYPKTHEHGSSVEVDLHGGGGRANVRFSENYILRPGDTVSFTARLSFPDSTDDFDFLAFYKARRIFLSAECLDETIDIVRVDSTPLRFLPVELNRMLSTNLSRFLSGDSLGFAKALITGDKSSMTQAFRFAAGAAGLYHVLAISGMHITMLAGMVLALSKNKRRVAMPAILIALLFTLTSGAGPAAVRACVMLAFALTATLVRRDTDPLTSLAVSLGLLLLINPFCISDIGLQLSFTATLGMVIFMPKASEWTTERLKTAPKLLRKPVTAAILSVAASVVAVAFNAPLCAIYFGVLPIFFPVANLLALWAIPFALGGAFLTALLPLVSQTLAQFAAGVTDLICRYFTQVCFTLARLPYAIVDMRNIFNVAWLVVSYWVLLVALAYKRGIMRYAAGFVVALLLFAIGANQVSRSLDSATFTLIDVGQGLSVVATDDGETVMVDCGGNRYRGAGVIAAEHLLKSGVRQIDTLFLTHLHDDHTNGLPDLLQFITVKRAVLPYLDEGGGDIADLLTEHGVEVVYTSANTEYPFGGSVVTAYRPVRRSGSNEQGSAYRLSTGDFQMLVTGDLNGTSEYILAEREDLSLTEVLVAGHHGSRYSSGEHLLEKLSAGVALVSSGKNSYGHPSEETLERFDTADMAVYRTDHQGNITIHIKLEQSDAVKPVG